jgi:hypothetical protein
MPVGVEKAYVENADPMHLFDGEARRPAVSGVAIMFDELLQ